MQDGYSPEVLGLPFGDRGRKSTIMSSPGSDHYALINHDVTEVNEPHCDDTRYTRVYCFASRNSKYSLSQFHTPGILQTLMSSYDVT